MKDIISNFCSDVSSYVRHATPEEKAQIEQELRDHIEDHAQALMGLGRNEEEATKRAVESMGNPKEIGEELNKEYPIIWLILSRIPAFLIAILVAILIISPASVSVYNAYTNLQARIAPETRYLSNDGHKVDYFFDIRREVPNANDVIRFYGSTVYCEDGKYYGLVGSSCYDKWIFGYASDNVHDNIRYHTLAGNSYSGGGGFSNSGASFHLRTIEVEYGQQYVSVSYDRFGTKWEAKIPLNWEGVE